MRNKKLIAVLMSTVFSAATCAQAFAADSVKDETVYVNLDSSGNVTNTIVVNSFKTFGNRRILDYGNYTEIKNLTTTAKPKVNHNYIEWELPADREEFYYQGKVQNAQLPWNFAIHYYLDGAEVPAERLINASGNLKITLDAESNPYADPYFSDNYMAQIEVAFDTEKCKNIFAPDATMMNVGNTKTATYMILPGNSKHYDITASIAEFEMDGITIGIVKMSDGILGNMDGLKVGMGQVTNGISQLMDGSGQLKNGAVDLASGIGLLNSGAAALSGNAPVITSGMSDVNHGITTLSDGIGQLGSASTAVRDGLSELDGNSYALSKGLSQIDSGLSELTAPKKTIESGMRELKKSRGQIDTLLSSGDTLKNGYGQILTGLETMTAQSDTIDNGLAALSGANTDLSALSNGAASIKSGADSLADANAKQQALIGGLLQVINQDDQLKAQLGDTVETINALSQGIGNGIGSISAGAEQLQAGAGTAQNGVNSLYGAAMDFGNGAKELSSGARTLYSNMLTLNNGLTDYTEGVKSADTLYNTADQFGNASLKLIDGAEKLHGGMGEVIDGFDTYAQGVNTLAGNYMTMDNAIYSLQGGASHLQSGFGTLMMGTDTLFSAMDELTDSIDQLDNGASQLPGGVDQLENGGQQLFGGILSQTGDIGNLLNIGNTDTVVSFAAPGIVTPNSVQFVIKTPNLHVPDEKKKTEEAPKQSFWQKLIQLFQKKK